MMTPAGKQHGMALIMILVLTTLGAMLALSAVQGAITQERIAGNLRAGVQARMAAETATAAAKHFIDDAHGNDQADRTAWPALFDTPLDQALDQSPAALPACDDRAAREALWQSRGATSLSVLPDQPLAPRAQMVLCRQESRAMLAVLGLAGNDEAPARFPALLAVERRAQGLATTNFVGGIAQDAKIQWPNSENSRLGARDASGNPDPDWPAVYFDHLADDGHEGVGTLDQRGVIDSMGENTSKVVEGVPEEVIIEARPSVDELDTTVDFLKAVHDACFEESDGDSSSGGSQSNGRGNGNSGGNGNGNASGGTEGTNLCDNVVVIPPGADKQFTDARLTGNQTFEGLYIDLTGQLDIRGNANIDGAVIVANITENADGSWRSAPNHTIKLAGGGKKGSVWFDELLVQQAIESLKQADADRFAELDIDTFWGGGSDRVGYATRGWLVPTF